MSNFKWNDNSQERILTNSTDINIVMFVSRNKDNKEIPDFKERRVAFATTWAEDDPRLHNQFQSFTAMGKKDEASRFYFSLNPRNNKKVMRAVQHFIIDNPTNINPAGLALLVTRVAMKRENASAKHRLFDFDSNDETVLNEFISDLKSRGLTDDDIEVRHSVNNYAIIINHGVDLRGLIDTMPDVKPNLKKDKGPWKWDSDTVTYKIDDLVLVEWASAEMSEAKLQAQFDSHNDTHPHDEIFHKVQKDIKDAGFNPKEFSKLK